MNRKPFTDYQPYDSGMDDDLEDTDESEDSEEEQYEDPRIRREQDPRYAILKAPGPIQSTLNSINPMIAGAPWDESTNVRSFANHEYLDPPKATKTSLISIRSTDRDMSIFPTPFRFQLKLPRVYKDITKFQLVQLSFPNGANNVVPTTLFTSSLVNKLLSQGIP